MQPHNLNNASDEIKLAVDIIFILESNNIDPEIALKALTIVKKDYENKYKQKSEKQETLGS